MLIYIYICVGSLRIGGLTWKRDSWHTNFGWLSLVGEDLNTHVGTNNRGYERPCEVLGMVVKIKRWNIEMFNFAIAYDLLVENTH